MQPNRPRRREILAWSALACVLGLCFLAPTSGTPIIWRIKGDSMEPAMHSGDIGFTCSTNYDDVRVGLPCVYKSESYPGPVLHRAYEHFRALGGIWTMKGDANPMIDPGYMDSHNFIAVIGYVSHAKQ